MTPKYKTDIRGIVIFRTGRPNWIMIIGGGLAPTNRKSLTNFST